MDFMKRIMAVSWSTKYCGKTIQFGMSLAEKYQAQLCVLHVFDTKWLQGFNIPMISVEEEHKKEMQKYKRELDTVIATGKDKGLNIVEIIEEGPATDVIMKLVKERHIDLLILRADEGTRFERMLVGGSNDDIVRAMPCSVLIV